MNLVSTISPACQGVLTSCERSTPLYLYRFAKSLLYSAYAGNLSIQELEVATMYGREELGGSSIPSSISLSDEFGESFFRVTNATTDAIVKFQGSLYVVTCYVEKELETFTPSIRVLALGPNSRNATVLLDYLTAEAVRQSPYSNAFLEVQPPGKENGLGQEFI